MSSPSAPEDDLGRRLAELSGDPMATAADYLALGRALHAQRRYADVEQLSAVAVVAHPAAGDLWNLRGVALRMLGRPSEALTALETALHNAPESVGALVNRGNVLMDLGQPAAAAESLRRAVELEPSNPLAWNRLGRAGLQTGKAVAALDAFRRSLALAPQNAEGWLELATILERLAQRSDAVATLRAGLAANPDHLQIIDALVLALRRDGKHPEAVSLLRDALSRRPNAPILHYHLGDLIRGADPAQGLAHLRTARTLDATNRDFAFGLLQALDAGGALTVEGEALDEAYALAAAFAGDADLSPVQIAVLQGVLARLCAFEDLAKIDRARDHGQAANGVYLGDLFHQIGRATTPQARRELMARHRLWGRGAETAAARGRPAAPARQRSVTDRLRLGFLSSDLRRHPVGLFALPLFEHVDPARFELFVYSHFRGPRDDLQAGFEARVSAYRWHPGEATAATVDRIANDQLDMLIELGGHTEHNRPEILAYRPAPVTASYLGYPHSTGLSNVDHFICDPFNRPTSDDLLLERPLILSRSWIALSETLVARYPSPDEELPADRTASLTFGTANNPNKCSPELMALWARILADTPGSRFAFIRPEARSGAYRATVGRAFEAAGLSPDRIDRRPATGAQALAAYRDIDISLDTIPLTGGTTTIDALMMGAPVVTLAGEAFHERLSHSILMNAGLADLSAADRDAYHRIAVDLATDRGRLRDLRRSLRARVLASPLGQPQAFADDFYAMVARAVLRRRVSA